MVLTTSVDPNGRNDSADAAALAGPHSDLTLISRRAPDTFGQTEIPIVIEVRAGDRPQRDRLELHQ